MRVSAMARPRNRRRAGRVTARPEPTARPAAGQPDRRPGQSAAGWRASLAAEDGGARAQGEVLRSEGRLQAKAAEDELDRGLIYAAHAGLVHPQAVRHIVRRTRNFEAWMRTQRGARGPARDVEAAVQLYLALETVAQIKAKAAKERGAKPPNREPALREVNEALELLFGEAPALTTLKGRMQRLRPRVAAFEAERKGARRERQRARRTTSAEAGPA